MAERNVHNNRATGGGKEGEGGSGKEPRSWITVACKKGYTAGVHAVCRSMNRSGQDSAEWGMEHPEEASALVVHHACILRNKRLLMTYV